MTIGKVHLTKHYARYRIRNPTTFQPYSFRTLDIGRKGHSKAVIGRLKGKTSATIQAILIKRKDYARGLRVKLHNGKALIYRRQRR